jgi:hypothetical protein
MRVFVWFFAFRADEANQMLICIKCCAKGSRGSRGVAGEAFIGECVGGGCAAASFALPVLARAATGATGALSAAGR